MSRTTFWRGTLPALAALLWAGGLPAQLADVRAGAGVRFESYSFGDAETIKLNKVQLLTLPVSARALLGSMVELGVSGAYASGKAERQSGEESTLSGLVDTEVRLTLRLAADRFRLGAVALVPTGTSQLEPEELDVAGLIAADVLPFAISNWGTGGGIGVNGSAALPLGPATTVGLSAGYVLAREYEPVAAFTYRPGNQLHVRAALDQLIGRSTKASVQLSYQQYSVDQADGANLYQAGDRIQALGTLAFPAGLRSSAILYAGVLRRLEGEYTNPLLPITPTEDLVYAGGTLRQPLGGAVLVPSVDLRVVGNDAGIDQGYTLTAGTAAELPFGTVELVPSARFRIGHITVRENQESGYTGMELGLTLRNRTVTR